MNMFDFYASMAGKVDVATGDEIIRYFSTPIEHTSNPLQWWHERRALYPHLSRMALDYLCIPGICPLFLHAWSQLIYL